MLKQRSVIRKLQDTVAQMIQNQIGAGKEIV